jgi:hypothetical protein
MSEIYKINDVEYEAEFVLSNPDGQEVKFTKSAIRGMTIVDNIFDPFISGIVSIANPYDFIENEYFIRGDGRDKLKIAFKPKESKSKNPEEDKFDHTFVIINDSDNVNPLVRSQNIKNFVLLDINAIPFSDQIPYGKSYSGKVGLIIKEIFKEVLGDDKVDEENWPEGDFEIQYIPPATYRYIDLIHHMMRLFYAKDGDMHVKGFISHDRQSDKFKMTLLSKTFEDNEKNTIEAFALGDLTSTLDVSNPNNPISDASYGEYIGGIKNLGYSTPSYGWNNDFFINALVFGYDPILGIHKTRKLSIEDIKSKWTTKFVDVFKSNGGKPKPFIVANKKSPKKFKRYVMPYPVEDSSKLVEAELYNNLTFYNLQVSFSNIGNTNRESGKFIDIFSTRGVNNDKALKSEEKILGRWYMTEIRHIFNGDLYTNQMFCTKTYIGPDSNVSEDVD